MVLAHQGGWDEVVVVLVPLVVFAILLRAANKRAEAIQRAEGDSADAPDADSKDDEL